MPTRRTVDEAVIRIENQRPHPVEGARFDGVFRISGAQYKRLSGQDFIQVTMLAQLTPERWAQMGAVAGKACSVNGLEVVDPVLQGMFRDEGERVGGLVQGEGQLELAVDDGVPPAEQ